MEISQFFGQDLTLSASGDLNQADSSDLTKQSIIRRLLTNPGTYIQHTDYGAGIGRFVGENLSAGNFDAIKNTIISQILNEETVARTPAPQITFSIENNTILICNIVYFDAILRKLVTINLKVS